MTRATEPQDAELRRVINQQITDLEMAAEIGREVAEPDLPTTDNDPFPVASSAGALRLIRDKMAAGQVTDSVIYFIARYSAHELENQPR